MPSPWLLLMLVGPAASLVLSTPSFPVSVSHGKTALLPVSLNFSSSVPTYFQIRWRFIPGPWLVLIVKADNCKADNGTRQWWDACKITVAKTERYRHRAEWSSEDTSLILRDARVEDSGMYDIKMLALGVRVSANINLTVINGTSNPPLNGAAFDDQRRGNSSSKSTNVAAPVSLAKVEFGRDYMLTNIIRLSLAGLILCLLGFIIAEMGELLKSTAQRQRCLSTLSNPLSLQEQENEGRGFRQDGNVASSYSRPRETRAHQMEIPFSSSPVEQCFLTCGNHPS